jgi:hypothetical protein
MKRKGAKKKNAMFECLGASSRIDLPIVHLLCEKRMPSYCKTWLSKRSAFLSLPTLSAKQHSLSLTPSI